jgi:DnaJ family protein C protein 19
MIWLLIGALILFTLLGGMRAFERASITTIKSLFAWIAALGGLSLALLLILTGRGGAAIGALVMFGPLLWQKFQAAHGPRVSQGAAQPGGQANRSSGAMSRQEALDILGLRPGASEAAIKEAHLRLMRRAHPDVGGSEWIATRINQARDVLLG